MQAQKRSVADGKRVGSAYRDSASSTRSNRGARACKLTPVERVTIRRVQCLAMTPVRSAVQGKGEWPSPLARLLPLLVRSCRAATRFTFASRRHCGSSSPEGGTIPLFSELTRHHPLNFLLPSALLLAFDWSSGRALFVLLVNYTD